MSPDNLIKPAPRSIAIFGASGRMGAEVASYLAYARPDIQLRLLSTSQSGQQTLAARFPHHDAQIADYRDRASLDRALDGVEGVFLVTSSGVDEHSAMTNFIAAARAAGTATHIVRIMGYPADSSPEIIPEHLRGRGDGDQHYVAKRVLLQSGLPITFLNIGASLMDNLIIAAPAIKQTNTFVWGRREVPLMDVRDVGEVAARLLLSNDARHIGQFHTINNGYDHPTTAQVAEIMSDVFRRTITNDDSWESFDREYSEVFAQMWGRPDEAQYRYQYFDFEYRHWMWDLNDVAEKLLGRKPNTFRSWLLEHRSLFEPAEDNTGIKHA